MISHLQSERSRKQLALAALLVVLVIFDQLHGAAAVQPLLETSLQPLRIAAMRGVQWFQLPLEAIFTSVDKAQRIKDLQERYARSLVTIAELEAVREENAQLRELLDQPERQANQQFLARPILSLSYPAVQGGSADAIAEGSIVTRAGVLVGRVNAVHEHQSQITLLAQKEMQPLLASVGDLQGIVRGDGRRILFTEIPKDATLKVGDQVATVGQENVPAKIFIGTVSSIENKPAAPTQTAILEQPVSFFDAAIVEVW